MTVRERLLSRLIIDPSGCLLWTGLLERNGYARMDVGGRRRYIHRVMWEMSEGPIPPGLTIDHVWDRGCRHKHCASIAHLEPVTPAENNRRRAERQTHCGDGHEFTEANTYVDSRGIRNCRICNAAAVRRYKARQKALQADWPARHSAVVTNVRLLTAYEAWFSRLSGTERDAVGIVRAALQRIAEEDERAT